MRPNCDHSVIFINSLIISIIHPLFVKSYKLSHARDPVEVTITNVRKIWNIWGKSCVICILNLGFNIYKYRTQLTS